MSNSVKSYSGAKVRIPDYDGNCITRLPPFFLDVLLGKTNPLAQEVSANVKLQGIKNIVFFLVDGFGVKQWETYNSKLPALQRFERDGSWSRLDTVFPASTPPALTTLHTNGLTPAQHGLIDWWLYVQEIDKIIATLPFTEMGNQERDSLSAAASASILVSNKTTAETMADHGIKPRVFSLTDYYQSAYTKASNKGSEFIPHENVKGLFETLSEHLSKPRSKPSFNFVYWGGVDRMGHVEGLDSLSYDKAVKEYFGALESFLAEAVEWKDTLFVMSADHGQINVVPEETIYLDTVAGLSELFPKSPEGKTMLPWGGPREVFLAIQDGQIDHALALLHNAIGEHVELLESKVAMEAGLFGSLTGKYPGLESRIGDIVVLPKDHKTVWYHHPGQEPFNLRGHHGGLSNDELQVPFALLRSK